jgi:hypothetical protein
MRRDSNERAGFRCEMLAVETRYEQVKLVGDGLGVMSREVVPRRCGESA